MGRRVMYDIDGPYIVAKIKLILEAVEPMSELCLPFNAIDKDGVAA